MIEKSPIWNHLQRRFCWMEPADKLEQAVEEIRALPASPQRDTALLEAELALRFNREAQRTHH